MKTSVKPFLKIFTLVLYEVVIEISTALECLHLHMQIADTKMKPHKPCDLKPPHTCTQTPSNV